MSLCSFDEYVVCQGGLLNNQVWAYICPHSVLEIDKNAQLFGQIQFFFSLDSDRSRFTMPYTAKIDPDPALDSGFYQVKVTSCTLGTQGNNARLRNVKLSESVKSINETGYNDYLASYKIRPTDSPLDMDNTLELTIKRMLDWSINLNTDETTKELLGSISSRVAALENDKEMFVRIMDILEGNIEGFKNLTNVRDELIAEVNGIKSKTDSSLSSMSTRVSKVEQDWDNTDSRVLDLFESFANVAELRHSIEEKLKMQSENGTIEAIFKQNIKNYHNNNIGGTFYGGDETEINADNRVSIKSTINELEKKSDWWDSMLTVLEIVIALLTIYNTLLSRKNENRLDQNENLVDQLENLPTAETMCDRTIDGMNNFADTIEQIEKPEIRNALSIRFSEAVARLQQIAPAG